jgi:hypothetical protein
VRGAITALCGFLLLAAQASQGQYLYTSNGDGTITITGYTGSGGIVAIPPAINGLRVVDLGTNAFLNCTNLTSVVIPGSVTNIENNAFYLCNGLTSVTISNGPATIGESAFLGCTSLTSVTIPSSVTSIGDDAFAMCSDLTTITIPGSVTTIGEFAFSFCYDLATVYFKGDAPTADSTAFYSDNATVYYLPGRTGWNSHFLNLWPVPWNPLIKTSGSGFGIENNQFGFDITGVANIPIVVEACSNLCNPTWSQLQIFTLTNGSVQFTDPAETRDSSRYYRIRSP